MNESSALKNTNIRFVGKILFKCSFMNFSMSFSSHKYTKIKHYQERLHFSIVQQIISQIYNWLKVKMLVLDGNQKNCCYHNDKNFSKFWLITLWFCFTFRHCKPMIYVKFPSISNKFRYTTTNLVLTKFLKPLTSLYISLSGLFFPIY